MLKDLSVADLTITRSGRHILNRVSITLSYGKAYALLGPNGSGKSTFLHALAGVVPYEGRIIGTRAISLMSALAGYHRDRTLANHCTLVARRPGIDKERLWTLVEQFYLCKLLRTRPRNMSLGEQRAVSLLAPLATAGDCVLLDEPFLALDSDRVSVLEGVVRDLTLSGKLVVISSHELPPISRCCAGLIILESGSVKFFGEISSFIAQARRSSCLVHPANPKEWLTVATGEFGSSLSMTERGMYRIEGFSMAEVLSICFDARIRLIGIWEDDLTLADALAFKKPQDRV